MPISFEKLPIEHAIIDTDGAHDTTMRRYAHARNSSAASSRSLRVVPSQLVTIVEEGVPRDVAYFYWLLSVCFEEI